jgi:hypothetical protein
MRPKKPKQAPFATNLTLRSEQLRTPTLVAAMVAQRTGATIRSVRPGRVDLTSCGANIQISVRMVNIYRGEAENYRDAGLPVPDYVLKDAKRWDREHGLA